MYISFTLESEYTISQLKYGSRYNSTNGIIEILRENLAYLKWKNIALDKKQALGSSSELTQN